ncbi:spore germination protein KB [Psychrobacillus insolitus]|uniref:Spore germination protein KB n=1 Tax=Psychrobacillus insolitus TaxID=1461 RepID=A0A2W7MC23_9BACI|nr:endospore germination permease [Psychrobacillus insolitus]PZX02424.1 spore germination protein KB [Psychrobacillus insolitus]
MQNGKISSFQFLVLVIFFAVGTSILLIPGVLTNQVKQDAWIATILGLVIGLVVIWLFTFIASWFPKLTYIQINEKVFGRILGKMISFLVILMAIIYTTVLISYSGVFLITQLYPKTPMVYLNVLMALIMVMAVRLGLETIARTAEILIFVFFFLFIFLAVSISPQIDVENLEPFFQVNINPLFKSSLGLAVVTSVNSIVLLLIFPAYVKEVEKARKYFFVGNIIGGIVIVVITLLCIFVLGSNTTARQIYPGYALAKVINIGDFLTRIESLMATLWIMGLFFKVSIYFYAATFGLSQILNMKDYRPLTYPLGLIVVVLSVIIFPNIVYQQTFNSETAVSFSLVIGLFFPLLLVAVYMMRKKKLKKDPDHS